MFGFITDYGNKSGIVFKSDMGNNSGTGKVTGVEFKPG